MHKKIIVMGFLLLPLLLTGCAAMNTNFDCPMKPGVTCESLDSINAKVDRGKIGREIILKKQSSCY